MGRRSATSCLTSQTRTPEPGQTGPTRDVDYLVIQRETSASNSGPVRTCVGCRKRELAVELLRMVAVSTGNGEDAVAVDTAGTLPGRGAWLHPHRECLGAAIRRRAFGRALRITGSPDVSAAVEFIDRAAAPDRPGKRTGSEEHEHTMKSR